MRGFFLDLSTKTGWAFFEAPDRPPVCGTLLLPKCEDENYAGRTLPLRRWLRKRIEDDGIELIGFEAPFIPIHHFQRKDPPKGKLRFTTTQHTLRLQIALATEIETTAAECRVACHEVPSVSVKKALAGRGRLVDKSLDMIAAALDRGWRVGDDNQADACGVGIAIYERVGRPVPFTLTAL